VKLVHLAGFIIKKFVTIHGHMNVKEIMNSVINVTIVLLGFVQLIIPLYTLYTLVMYLYDNTVSYLTIVCFCLYSFSSITGLMLTYIRGRNWLPDNKQYQELFCVCLEIKHTLLITSQYGMRCILVR
jgi:hypothetical protein